MSFIFKWFSNGLSNFRAGNEIIIDNDELEFQNFTKLDASDYRCVAENDLGKIEKTIKLTYYGNV